MAECDVSQRSLYRATKKVDPKGKGVSHGYIGAVARGDDAPPSLKTIELLAAALEVDPAVFIEYRLARARRRLDPAEVGLDAAAAYLNQIERNSPLDHVEEGMRALEDIGQSPATERDGNAETPAATANPAATQQANNADSA